MSKIQKDVFRLHAPTRRAGNNREIVRLSGDTYDRVAELSDDTGMSMRWIVDKCVAFALDRLEVAEHEQ
jgi:hypothetical protein